MFVRAFRPIRIETHIHLHGSTGLLYFKHLWTLTMQGGAAIRAATRIPEDFTTLGLPRPVEVVRGPFGPGMSCVCLDVGQLMD